MITLFLFTTYIACHSLFELVTIAIVVNRCKFRSLDRPYFPKESLLRFKIILFLTLASNFLAFFHMFLSIAGELITNDDTLLHIETFTMSLKFFYPLLSIGLTLPIEIWFRR